MKRVVGFMIFTLVVMVACERNETPSDPIGEYITFSQKDSIRALIGTSELRSITLKLDTATDTRCDCTTGFCRQQARATFLVFVNESVKPSDTLKLLRRGCLVEDDRDLLPGNMDMDVKIISGINIGLVNVTHVPPTSETLRVKVVLF